MRKFSCLISYPSWKVKIWEVTQLLPPSLQERIFFFVFRCFVFPGPQWFSIFGLRKCHWIPDFFLYVCCFISKLKLESCWVSGPALVLPFSSAGIINSVSVSCFGPICSSSWRPLALWFIGCFLSEIHSCRFSCEYASLVLCDFLKQQCHSLLQNESYFL